MKIKSAILIAAFVGWALPASAAPPPYNNAIDQNIMIVIATATSGTGVSMLRLVFPSAESCEAAAKILQQDIRGGYVTARCVRTH